MGHAAYDELKWRGLVYDNTESVPEMLAKGPVTVYTGFDATADSLHVGHMVPLMTLARLQRFGHIPVAVAGGASLPLIGALLGHSQAKTTQRYAHVANDPRLAAADAVGATIAARLRGEAAEIIPLRKGDGRDSE